MSKEEKYNVETLNPTQVAGIGVAVFSALILVLKIKNTEV